MPRQAEVSAAFIPRGMKGATSRWCGSAQRPGQNRAPRLASASRWPLRRQPAISSLSRSGRISRVDVQLHADLSARGANLAAHRLKLRSRLRDVYVRRPHPWALDVTRNAGACDAPRKRLLGMQRYTVCEHSLTSPEGTERAETLGIQR